MQEFGMKEAMEMIGEQHVVNLLNQQTIQEQAILIIQLRVRITELAPDDPLAAPKEEDNPAIAVAVDEDETVDGKERVGDKNESDSSV